MSQTNCGILEVGELVEGQTFYECEYGYNIKYIVTKGPHTEEGGIRVVAKSVARTIVLVREGVMYEADVEDEDWPEGVETHFYARGTTGFMLKIYSYPQYMGGDMEGKRIIEERQYKPE
jgi:hypothetical protein